MSPRLKFLLCYIGIVIVALIGSSCAHAEDRAVVGQILDDASTIAAVSDGFVELNPTPLVVLLPVKIIAAKAVEKLDHDDCVVAKRALGASGFGCFGWNLMLLIKPELKVVALLVGAVFGSDHDKAEAACPKEEA